MPTWLLSGALWKVIGAVALSIFMWWAWDHFVANPYIAQGVAKEQPKTAAEKNRADAAEAANVTLADRFRALQTAFADQTSAMLDLAATSASQLKNRDRIIAGYVKIQQALNSELDSLRAEKAKPAATKEEACDEATRLLDAYAAGQLRK